jgi:hypothetical protein
MTWGNPPPIEPTEPKQGKVINPEDLAGDSESSQQKALFDWWMCSKQSLEKCLMAGTT